MALAAWASEVAEGVVAGAGEVASGVAAATEVECLAKGEREEDGLGMVTEAGAW